MAQCGSLSGTAQEPLWSDGISSLFPKSILTILLGVQTPTFVWAKRVEALLTEPARRLRANMLACLRASGLTW